MAVEKTDKVVQIKLPSGVTVWVMYYGATVITWKNANGQENLFLSEYCPL
jgi:glucose-6-phosphate 1-epimerase